MFDIVDTVFSYDKIGLIDALRGLFQTVDGCMSLYLKMKNSGGLYKNLELKHVRVKYPVSYLGGHIHLGLLSTDCWI